jgi:hypothetical protein
MGIFTLGHITPIKRRDVIIAAKVRVYPEDEECFRFMTPEAYHELQKWILHRSNSEEIITDKSWVMRNIWETNRGVN